MINHGVKTKIDKSLVKAQNIFSERCFGLARFGR